MQLINGKQISQEIQQEIAFEVKRMMELGLKQPHLAAVLVGNDGGSETYVASKIKACERVGFKSSLIRHPKTVSEKELLQTVYDLNHNNDIDGFIVQLPLPDHINEQKIIEALLPNKDIDGFHPINIGRMILNLPCFVSATPFGIIQLLERYKIETTGKNCVVIGRSHIVGLPMSILLSKNNSSGNCTVTLCHSKTKNLKFLQIKFLMNFLKQKKLASKPVPSFSGQLHFYFWVKLLMAQINSIYSMIYFKPIKNYSKNCMKLA